MAGYCLGGILILALAAPLCRQNGDDAGLNIPADKNGSGRIRVNSASASRGPVSVKADIPSS